MSSKRLPGRRAYTSSRRSNSSTVPAIARWILLVLLTVGILFVWIGTAFHFLAADNGTTTTRNGLREQQHKVLNSEHHNEHIVALDLAIDPQHTITIRITVFHNQCPKAYEFLKWMIENQQTELSCRPSSPCTIYRGEPVPSYWGSKDYPDRWDNNGRWGPPYALVQGGFPNTKFHHIEREEAHRPEVKRGMVAWAGPHGVHFFIALADHPEWKHEHTVWGGVFEEDMALVDALVKDHPLKVLEHNVPVVTNFVHPMPFKMREDSS
ncbi:hypothetical protein ACHAXR_012565 [Thalassiosira sp. AJA248-18]